MEDRDIGLQALEKVYQLMFVDDEWSRRADRRFTWWSGPTCQTISASAPMPSRGLVVSRLAAVTRLVSGVRLDDRTFDVLNTFNKSGRSLSALVYDRVDTVSLLTTAIVHEQVFEYLSKLFALVAAAQVAVADTMGAELAGLLRGERITSAHPISGPRSVSDDLVHLYEGAILPAGLEPSRCGENEIAEADALLQLKGLPTLRKGRFLSVFCPYQGSASLLEVDGSASNEYLGSGLRITLKLPDRPEEASALAAANALNLAELLPTCVESLIGAWHVGEGPTITFGGFYPNTMLGPGVALNGVLSMASRAGWIGAVGDSRTTKERLEALHEWVLRVLPAKEV